MVLTCLGACFGSSSAPAHPRSSEGATLQQRPTEPAAAPSQPTSTVPKASAGITPPAKPSGQAGATAVAADCATQSSRPQVVPPELQASSSSIQPSLCAQDQSTTTFVSVDIAGFRQQSAIHGLAKMTRLLDRLVLLFNGLCVTHNMQRLHLSGRRRPLTACAAVPLEWADNHRPSHTSGSEVTVTAAQPQDPQARAASALTFAQELISSARKVLVLPEGAIPIRIGMYSGPSSWYNPGDTSPNPGDDNLDDSPLTRSALAAICVQRSCAPERIQACASTVQALVASCQCEQWEWQPGEQQVKTPGQDPISTFQWLLWQPAPSRQPSQTVESPRTSQTERPSIRASGSASYLQAQRRGSLVSQMSGAAPVALSHELVRMRSRGSGSRPVPSIALQYLQALQSLSSVSSDVLSNEEMRTHSTNA